jgi:hypothetical protein
VSRFKELVAVVQVGTQKADPPRSGTIDDYNPGTKERTVLAELGTLDLMRRAGATAKPMQALTLAPAETMRVARDAPLQEAFSLSEELLIEWLTLAAQRGRLAPPRALPSLLAMPKRHHPLVWPVLGERGRWLASQLGIEYEEPLSSSDAARRELEASYDELDTKDRARLLDLIGSDVRLDDQPLLMRALTDKNKEVRVAALGQLLKIASSEPTRELRAIAERTLSVKKSLLSKSLQVDPPTPDSLPKWLPRLTGVTGMGPNALALLDVVRHVPLGVWAQITGSSPAELLNLGGKTDFALALYEGWQEAAIRFKDQSWIDEFFKHTPPDKGTSRAELVPLVSEPVYEPIMIERLRRKGDIAPLLTRRRQFSPSLSRAIVESAQAGVADPYLYKNISLQLDPSVLPLVQNAWSEDERLDALREHWRRILDLRSRLLKSLEP